MAWNISATVTPGLGTRAARGSMAVHISNRGVMRAGRESGLAAGRQITHCFTQDNTGVGDRLHSKGTGRDSVTDHQRSCHLWYAPTDGRTVRSARRGQGNKRRGRGDTRAELVAGYLDLGHGREVQAGPRGRRRRCRRRRHGEQSPTGRPVALGARALLLRLAGKGSGRPGRAGLPCVF